MRMWKYMQYYYYTTHIEAIRNGYYEPGMHIPCNVLCTNRCAKADYASDDDERTWPMVDVPEPASIAGAYLQQLCTAIPHTLQPQRIFWIIRCLRVHPAIALLMQHLFHPNRQNFFYHPARNEWEGERETERKKESIYGILKLMPSTFSHQRAMNVRHLKFMCATLNAHNRILFSEAHDRETGIIKIK